MEGSTEGVDRLERDVAGEEEEEEVADDGEERLRGAVER